ncbi:MAG: thioredoxin [Sphaerochaetaceae bacterium]|jgi:thioredoxin 1|nr:thioredoxin [Sphaerochaetaceae bacterium]NLY06826.1 thioredoxin [Spirochaetales bacterium]
MSEITLTADNFESEVLKSKVPVLVDFWAPWCGPCRMIAPSVAQLAEKYEGKIKVGKVNVDDASDLASSYGIASIPSLLVFQNGKVASQRVGGAPMSVLESFVAPFLK